MKSARLQVLTTPAFRDWLRKEARKAGVSMGELVRTRCQQPADDRVGDRVSGRAAEEEAALAQLTALLRKEVTATRAAVRRDLDETHAILNEMRARRKPVSVEDVARDQDKERA